MARRRARLPLNVFMNGRLVGRLRREASGATDFRYDPDWLAWEHALPVSLSLPLREDRYTGGRVVAVLDNLLPDSEAVRRRLAQRIHADGHDGYSLLARIGRDCVGALQFLPEGVEPGPAGAVAGRAARAVDIEARLADLAAAPLGIDENAEFRISLAGAQEKTALLFWKRKWHLPQGTTPTTHILKPRIGRLSGGIDLTRSVENEYLCMKLTGAFGLPTAKVAMADFGSVRTLVVERFDRRWTEDKRLLRLPQEDFCQALGVPPTLKYESDGGPGMTAMLELLKGSDEPEQDRRLLLKAQIVFWLLGATDGHAKNFSIFLLPGGRFRLTPLYDVMSVQPARDAGQLQKKMRLALAVGENRHDVIDEIMPRHFMQTAAANGMPQQMVRGIIEEVLGREEAAIGEVMNALPDDFPGALAESIIGGLRRRLRICERASSAM